MRAYLIDPEGRTVEEVEIAPNGLDDIYSALGCDCFDVVAFNSIGDVVYVDDEGLLKGPTTFFLIDGYPQPLAGRGLVFGTDPEGNSIEATVDIDWLRANVDFGTPLVAGNRVLFMGDRHIREIQH